MGTGNSRGITAGGGKEEGGGGGGNWRLLTDTKHGVNSKKQKKQVLLGHIETDAPQNEMLTWGTLRTSLQHRQTLRESLLAGIILERGYSAHIHSRINSQVPW